MLQDILEFLQPREERLMLGTREVIVREVASNTELVALAGEDPGYMAIVLSVVDLDGKPVFTPDDIPALKAAPQSRLTPITQAVARVMGWDLDAEAKKPQAAPDGG